MELNEIYEVEKKFDAEIQTIAELNELESVRVKYLGKKGFITDIMSKFREVPAEQKKEFGQKVNALKGKIEKSIEETKASIENLIEDIQDSFKAQKMAAAKIKESKKLKEQY